MGGGYYDLLFLLIGTCTLNGYTVNSQNTQNTCRPICTNAECKNSCPEDRRFLLTEDRPANLSECSYPSTTTEQYNTSTVQTTTSESYDNHTFVCVSKCPVGFYGNDNECFQCDSLCSNCTGQGITVDVCSCRYVAKNGTCTNSNPEDEKGLDLAIIIGAAVGGTVAIVILIIVMVICIRCRGDTESERSKKSRMSMLIENRDDTIDNRTHIVEERKEQRKNPTLTRPNYENTGKFDDSIVANQAQRNQDKIFRYVKDPATGKTIEKEETRPTKRESDIYGNATAIKLNRAIGGNVRAEDIELEMLPAAPKPPGPSKKKPKALSKKADDFKSRAPKSSATNKAFEPGFYMDMTGAEEEPQDDYENYEKDENSEEPLEDYENFGKTSTLLKQNVSNESDEEQEDYENFQVSPKRKSNRDSDELEDYENATAAFSGGIPPLPRGKRAAATKTPKASNNLENSEESPYMNVDAIKGYMS